MPNAAESPLATYIAHLKRGELGYQFSPSSQQAVFYPRVIAPKTGAADLEWRVSKGLGTVHATTVVHPQQGAKYNVCLVDVDEGFRMGPMFARFAILMHESAHKLLFTNKRWNDWIGTWVIAYPVFTPAEGV